MIGRRALMRSLATAICATALENKGHAQMIEPVSVTEQMMYITVRLIGLDGSGKEIQTGTGFIYNIPGKIAGTDVPILVTNKHVIAGAETISFVMHSATTLGATKPTGNAAITVPAKAWIGHPNPAIDLCGTFIGEAIRAVNGFYKAFAPGHIYSKAQLEELQAVEETLMIGYPNGLWDATNNFPLMRRGITSSHPAIDYMVNGAPCTVVDIASFPGSSGSPVILYSPSGIFMDKKGDAHVGNRAILLGVLFAGPFMTTDGRIEVRTVPTRDEPVAVIRQMLNLGYVVKAREIIALGEAMLKAAGQN